MTMQAQPAVSIVPGSLRAVLDKRLGPGKPCSFVVTVDIEGDASWTVTLVAARPQGINPLIKLLHLEIVRPPDAGAQTMGSLARRRLRYKEASPGAHYTEVWLGDGDRAVSARVSVAG